MLLIFQERFAKQVETGTKTCTIRKGSRWRTGMTAHIRRGSQWKHEPVFNREVLEVATIKIASYSNDNVMPAVTVNDKALTMKQAVRLAHIDGFLNAYEFYVFFCKGNPDNVFEGQWIIFSEGAALDLFNQITAYEN